MCLVCVCSCLSVYVFISSVVLSLNKFAIIENKNQMDFSVADL